MVFRFKNTLYLGIISFDSSMYMFDPHGMIVLNLMKISIDLKWEKIGFL